MPTLRIEIQMDNAAFHDENGEPTPFEAARILRHAANAVENERIALNEPDTLILKDVNGNTCGKVSVEE